MTHCNADNHKTNDSSNSNTTNNNNNDDDDDDDDADDDDNNNDDDDGDDDNDNKTVPPPSSPIHHLSTTRPFKFPTFYTSTFKHTKLHVSACTPTPTSTQHKTSVKAANREWREEQTWNAWRTVSSELTGSDTRDRPITYSLKSIVPESSCNTYTHIYKHTVF